MVAGAGDCHRCMGGRVAALMGPKPDWLSDIWWQARQCDLIALLAK
jgi:hypothetical protein